jgi:hypothetical protein
MPRIAIVACLVGALCVQPALAQELTPRSFWPAPVGTQLLVLGYSHTAGDVLMDPSIPLFGVDSRIDTGVLGYFRTFDLWGRTANVVLELPYSKGTTKGLVGDVAARRDFAGFNDASITLMVNLLGAPAMTPQEFQALRADPRPILGLSLKLVAPSGHYDVGRLINVGANRWAARLKLGFILPLRPKWLLEIDAGAWFFGADDEFLTGERKQDPIYALETHLIRRFSPGFWASLEFNYFTGGRQTIGGNELADLQNNSRMGATLVFPYLRRYAVKMGYSVSMRTRFGVDSDQFLLTWQMLLR